jgi:glucokinase
MPLTPLRQATMSALNESLVLDFVREHDETSRAAIAAGLGLSPASVSRIVGRLVRAGLVTELPRAADGPGRPAARLRFDRRAGSVLAIDLGGTKCHGVIADLAGTIVVEDLRPTTSKPTPYETLRASIDALLEAAPAPVVAAAIGVPALVEPSAGYVLEGPNVLWHDFALGDELRAVLDVPIVIDNDVKLAAMAQAWRGLGRGIPDFATVAIGTGVGAAIVANGELVRGRHNAAGEVGYLILDSGELGEPHAAGLGGLERVITGPGITARARELLAAEPGHSRLDPATITSEDVLASAQSGDPIARQVVDGVLDALLKALIALCVTADPAIIIIDGGVGRSLEPYLGRLSEGLARHTPWTPTLAVSQLETSSTVIGAIATALWLDRQRATRGVPTDPRSARGSVVHAA